MDLERWCRWYKRRGAGRLRRVLMREWDPIGVAGIPAARDEYDAYLGPIADKLRVDASADEITSLLEFVRQDRMGLPADRDEDGRVAAAISDWYAAEVHRRAMP